MRYVFPTGTQPAYSHLSAVSAASRASRVFGRSASLVPAGTCSALYSHRPLPGVGSARSAVDAASVWADDDYYKGVLKDRMSEYGLVVNYFVWDHANKTSLDVSRVVDNGGVSATSPGYMVSATKGVVLEDGWMLRLQWQVNF